MWLPRIVKFVKRLAVVAVGVIAVFVATIALFAARCNGPGNPPKIRNSVAVDRAQFTADIPEYARAEESTFLGYPEWFIVWSYTERADYLAKGVPSGFPYWRSIEQYWYSYCCVHGVTRGKYPFNFGEHEMLVVIGSSFTLEYAIRSAYENTVGRLTEWSASNEAVEEDRFANGVAREYADFVHVRPFYEFSFWQRLRRLWSENHLEGKHPLRKLERRFFLSLDFGLQAFYCWIIEKASHSTYGIESAETYVLLDNADRQLLERNLRIRVVKPAYGNSFVAVIPRYQEFTDVAQWLAEQDIPFVEIAGNDEIAISVVSPATWTFNLSAGQLILSDALAIDTARKRSLIAAPVKDIHKILRELKLAGVSVEHVYDY